MITEADITDEQFNKALKYYVILDRDVEDFMEGITKELNDKVLQGLYILLATPNPKQSKQNRNMNLMGAGMVKRTLNNKGYELPSIGI